MKNQSKVSLTTFRKSELHSHSKRLLDKSLNQATQNYMQYININAVQSSGKVFVVIIVIEFNIDIQHRMIMSICDDRPIMMIFATGSLYLTSWFYVDQNDSTLLHPCIKYGALTACPNAKRRI